MVFPLTAYQTLPGTNILLVLGFATHLQNLLPSFAMLIKTLWTVTVMSIKQCYTTLVMVSFEWAALAHSHYGGVTKA